MSNIELQVLADLASQHSKILEIGSYLGRSTRAMADHTSGFVIACDNFKGPVDIVLTWKERAEIYEKFLANMGEHIQSGKVLPWKIDHRDMAEHISEAPKPPKYDMVFIDGSHKHEDISRDIQFASSVLEAGGLMCGHDYDLATPGVAMAVNQLLPGFTVVPESRIWCKTIES